MAVLWPESDSDRARHALSQTLYHTRSTLQESELFLAGNEIRLNPAVMTADVWEFERLLSAHDDEGAIALYRGAFLDGFNLPGSPEFEDWASAQQRHYASLATAALERLGDRAEADQRWAAAVQWRQRLAALDITSSRATLKLMDVLVKAGNPAAALRHADVHRRAVRALFETEPDASIAALEARIRAPRPTRESAPQPSPAAAKDESRAATPARAQPVSVTQPAQAAQPAPAILSPPPATPAPPTPLHPPPSARKRRAWVLAPMAAAAAAALWFAAPSLRNSSAPANTDADSIVVAPFRVTGASADLAYLNEGIVELLSARFQDQALTRAVDPGQAITDWRSLGGAPNEVDTENALRLAGEVDASGVIVGSVVGTPERMYISATLINAPAGSREVEVSAEGPIDSLAGMMDQLAAKLLALKYGESDRLSPRRRTSLAALRLYLVGQQAYRRGEYQVAARQFELALRADSQFTLAAYQLALASDRINGGEQNAAALSIAWNGRSDLAPRDRAQLIALAGPEYPQPSSRSEVFTALASAVNARPLRSDVWYEFGERLLRKGPPLVDDATRRAINAFERALELDPRDRAGARPMLVIAAARLNDTVTMLRYASPEAVDDSMRGLSPFVRWTIARVRGDEEALERLRARFPQMNAENLRLISMSSLYDGVLREDGERAARLLAARTVGSRGLDALLALHAFAMAAGDSGRALEITERIRQRFPGMRAHLRLRVQDAVYGGSNVAAAERAVAELERETSRATPVTELERALYHADLCVLEQWRLHRGNHSTTTAAIRTLRSSGFPRVPVAISTNPHACANMLETWLAVETRSPGARERVMALDSLLLDGPAVGDATRYARILIARLYLRMNDQAAALAALRQRTYLAGWPRYQRTVRLAEMSLARAQRSAQPLRGF